MKKLWSTFGTLALSGMLIFSACSNTDQLVSPGDDNLPGEESLSLEKAFGGFEDGDEQPAFGDEELLLDIVEDEDAGDPIVQEGPIAKALNVSTTPDSPDSATVKVYFLRITYGLLEGDSTATEVVDWSGSAEVSKGTLVVLKTIRFERNDFIHFPRESRQIVDFTSQTVQHFDGMLLAIIANDSTDDGIDGTFTFNAGSYSKVLNFSELDSLDLLEPVGSAGHEVSIITRTKDIIDAPGGFFSGRWLKTRPNGGEFKGRWINSLGTNAGHLRGIWGITDDGNQVFKGKYISINGEFRGLIAGHWESTRDNGGVLRGRWVNRARQTVGIMRGHFKTGHENDRRGFFHGRYRVVNRDNAEGDDG